jgi:hypothetical protein
MKWIDPNPKPGTVPFNHVRPPSTVWKSQAVAEILSDDNAHAIREVSTAIFFTAIWRPEDPSGVRSAQ